MASQNLTAVKSLFDFEEIEIIINNNDNKEIDTSIDIFNKIDEELFHLFDDEATDIEFGDDTDGPIDLIKEVVNKVKAEFESIVEDPNKQKFLQVLSKVFARLLSVKVENIQKITNIIIISLSWSEQN